MSSYAFLVVLLTLLASYAGLHVYTYRKFRSSVGRYRGTFGWILAALGCSVVVAELALHFERLTTLLPPLAWMAFTWMGFVFLFSSVSFVVDALGVVARLTGQIAIHQALASRQRSYGVALGVLLLVFFGIRSAHEVNLKTVVIQSSRLHNPIRMVQISDLHLGVMTRSEDIRRLVTVVNALNPDLIFSTGDLVDMQLDHIGEFAEILHQLHAAKGKFAILGNHEVFAGVDASTRFIENAGFQLIRNAAVMIDNEIAVLGVDDPAVERRVTTSSVKETDLITPRFANAFTILLRHQPVADETKDTHIDLQLSGHTHGGQIFPFGLLTRLIYSLPFGLSQRGPNQWIYVSRGTGTWGPPMRILAPPEITLIEARPTPVTPKS